MHHLYDPTAQLQAMRSELTDAGFSELKTPAEVDAALRESQGTLLLMINSVCGCAAGSARPGTVLSLAGEPQPERLYTVFAGQDREATEAARRYIPHPPSSPSVVLFKDGRVVAMLHRHGIEGHTPEQVAAALRQFYVEHCG